MPRGGIIRVGARTGGSIERVFVKEGDIVHAGQPLARIRLITAMAGGQDSAFAAKKALEAEATAIDEQAVAARRKLLTEQADIKPKIQKLLAQLSEVNQQISYQRQQVDLAKNDVTRFERLVAAHAMSSRELDSARAALLSAEQTLTQQRVNALGIEQQIQEANARLHTIPTELASSIAGAKSERAQLTQKIIQTNAQDFDLIVASINGRVLALPADQGQSLTPGATVAVIASFGTALEAELYVPSRAIGFVKPGDEVRLMYQAFPHEKFGTSKGTIISVSRTLLAPSEVTIPESLPAKQPVFRVRAKISDQVEHAYGQSISLQPGMQLSASIIFDRRTLFQWLFDPIYAVRR